MLMINIKTRLMELYFTGIIIAACTFLIIGICHPIVIKMEYYTGTKYWWTYLIIGIIAICGALGVRNVIGSSVLGVVGASFLWAIGELFEQKRRVEKGWFPMNPKRKDEYTLINPNKKEMDSLDNKEN